MTTTEPAVSPRSASRLLREERVVARWLSAEFASTIGDQFLIVALAVMASQQGPVAAGFVLGVGTIPAVLTTLLSGAVVDRIGYRTAMFGADVGRLVVLMMGGYVLLFDPGGVATLATIAGLTGFFGAFYDPAAIAFAPSIVPAKDLQTVFAARMTATRAAILVGAPLAGLTVSKWGGAVAVFLDSATFALSALVVLTLPRPASHPDHGESTSVLASILAGYRYIFVHRLLMPALLIFAVLEFGLTGPVNVGLPLMAQGQGWSATVVGTLLALFGAGATVGPALCLHTTRLARNAALPLGLGAVTCAAAGLALLPAAGSRAATSLVAFGLGLGSSWLASLVVPALQAACDPTYLGRLGGAMTFTFQSVTPLSMMATGYGVHIFGLTATFAVGAGLVACACAAMILVSTVRAAATDGATAQLEDA